MPGFTLCYQRKYKKEFSFNELNNSVSGLLFNKNYSKIHLIKYEDLNLFLTKYLEYPFAEFKNERFDIFIEGRVYSEELDLLKKNLLKIAYLLEDGIQALKKWVLNVDGDFIIIIHDKIKKELLLFNDALGRLPVYIFYENSTLLVSREISFYLHLLKKYKVDKVSVSQFLFIGYPLSDRTFFTNVKRLNPATLIKIDIDKDEINVQKMYEHNLDEKVNENISLGKAVENLKELFLDACQSRSLEGHKNIISLSGGLDSRSVISAFNKLNLKYEAATYLLDQPSNKMDVEIAQQIASASNCYHKIFNLKNIENHYEEFILNTKLGANQIGLAFLVKYLEIVSEYYGTKITFFTGDGGDKVLPYISVPNVKSTEELVEKIIASRQESFSLSRVLRIVNFDENDFKSELYDILNKYPENSTLGKLSHFLIFERGFKWLFEGEDRNRYWFWSVTPFYSMQFFNYAMSIPNNFKKNHVLYKRFLVELSNQIANIKDFRWGVPITSKKIIILNFLKERIFPELPAYFKRKIHHKLIDIQSDDNNLIYLKGFFSRFNNKNNWVSLDEIKKIQSFTNVERNYLSTIFNLQEKFNKNKIEDE